MIDFKKVRLNLYKNYKEELKEVKYWEKIYIFFRKQKNKKIKIFSKEFTHNSNIFSNFTPDDELKIESFAKEFGYEIIDEEIGSLKSKYTFKLKEE